MTIYLFGDLSRRRGGPVAGKIDFCPPTTASSELTCRHHRQRNAGRRAVYVQFRDGERVPGSSAGTCSTTSASQCRSRRPPGQPGTARRLGERIVGNRSRQSAAPSASELAQRRRRLDDRALDRLDPRASTSSTPDQRAINRGEESSGGPMFDADGDVSASTPRSRQSGHRGVSGSRCQRRAALDGAAVQTGKCATRGSAATRDVTPHFAEPRPAAGTVPWCGRSPPAALPISEFPRRLRPSSKGVAFCPGGDLIVADETRRDIVLSTSASRGRDRLTVLRGSERINSLTATDWPASLLDSRSEARLNERSGHLGDNLEILPAFRLWLVQLVYADRPSISPGRDSGG